MCASAEILGEALRSFELRSCGAWPEHGNAGIAQRIRQAIDKRPFRPDHHEPDVVARAEGGYGGMIGNVEIGQCRLFGNAGVAGRGIECIAQG